MLLLCSRSRPQALEPHSRQLLQSLVERIDFYTEGLQSRYPEQRLGICVLRQSLFYPAGGMVFDPRRSSMGNDNGGRQEAADDNECVTSVYKKKL